MLFIDDSFSQTTEGDKPIGKVNIDFKFKNSRRYPDNLVEISLKRTFRFTKSKTVYITSKPMNNNPKMGEYENRYDI